jgi:hypothetical protein
MFCEVRATAFGGGSTDRFKHIPQTCLLEFDGARPFVAFHRGNSCQLYFIATADSHLVPADNGLCEAVSHRKL